VSAFILPGTERLSTEMRDSFPSGIRGSHAKPQPLMNSPLANYSGSRFACGGHPHRHIGTAQPGFGRKPLVFRRTLVRSAVWLTLHPEQAQAAISEFQATRSRWEGAQQEAGKQCGSCSATRLCRFLLRPSPPVGVRVRRKGTRVRRLLRVPVGPLADPAQRSARRHRVGRQRAATPPDPTCGLRRWTPARPETSVPPDNKGRAPDTFRQFRIFPKAAFPSRKHRFSWVQAG